MIHRIYMKISLIVYYNPCLQARQIMGAVRYFYGLNTYDTSLKKEVFMKCLIMVQHLIVTFG